MLGTNEDSITSPKSRLKLLCSYGGKILPRADGTLKYVGGETRVVSVPRSITFTELKEKIGGTFDNTDIVIKYQVIPEDLDVLVSVRSDEDLQYMLEEYDRHESLPPRSPSSSSRFRVFLFPCVTLPATPRSPSYVDVINASGSSAIPISNHPNIPISNSVCTSPTSTVDCSTGGGRPSGLGMHRVRSTPNLSGSLSQLANSGTAGMPSGSHQKSRMGGPHRYEACGCGQRRNYFAPSYGPQSGGHWGHPGQMEESSYRPRSGHPGQMEESYRSRSGHSSFQFSGQPPVAPPRRNIWD